VSINFREIDREFLGNLNGFLKHFCAQVTRKLKVPNRLEDYWDGGLGSKGDCGEYFEDHLLPLMSGALVLELDEMDVLFEGKGDKAWAIDFLSMLRAWFEKWRTSEKWKKLRLVLVHAKDIDQETLQQAQSPFNVGTEIELGEFNAVQVSDLAVRHGLEASIAPSLMALVGGHPQLVRLGLYSIARGEVSLDILVSEGATEAGFYGNYLRQVRRRIEKDPGLLLAFKRVLASMDAITIDQSSRSVLQSLGVVKMHRNDVKIACELYRQYFGGLWS
jgi:AAA-like domain